jgi:hypothetical protein
MDVNNCKLGSKMNGKTIVAITLNLTKKMNFRNDMPTKVVISKDPIIHATIYH